jgi:hypothetical protein
MWTRYKGLAILKSKMERLKLKGVLALLDVLFLGVIEEVQGIGRYSMKTITHPDFVRHSGLEH